MVRKTIAVVMASLFAATAYSASDSMQTPIGSNAQRDAALQNLKADAVGAVLFDSSVNGWPTLTLGTNAYKAVAAASVGIADGAVELVSNMDSGGVTGVYFPHSLIANKSNYEIEMEIEISAELNNSRWFSIMYRTTEGNIPYPYFQFAMRRNATANNGTELAYRTPGNTWDVRFTKAHSAAFNLNQRYTLKAIVYDNRVQHFINGELVHDLEMPADIARTSGGVGFQTAGLRMKVYRYKVTERLTALPALPIPPSAVTVQDTGTTAAMAPTLVQAMSATTVLPGSGISQALYSLDSQLNLTGANAEALGSLEDYFAQTGRVTIPVLRVNDQVTADALVNYLKNVRQETDLTVLSANVDLLRALRISLPGVRTAVDFSALSLTDSSADILRIVGDTNRALAKIAVLPSNLVTRDVVARVQRLLITVWAPSTAASAEEAARILLTGVNGIISENSTPFASVLRKLPANTLLRKPLVTGHRGMPAREDENTLEGAVAAAAVGADAIETDIYLTTDNEIVVMHDATVNRTTFGTGNIEGMTLAQVKSLETRDKRYKVPTLREMLREFKGQPITQFIEIKSGKPEIVPALKALLEEEGVMDQSIVIAFGTDQLNRLKQEIPGISGGFLTSTPTGPVTTQVNTVLAATQAYSSTFNPDYGGGNLTSALMEATKHRGTTFWPWTYRNAADFYKYYSLGTHGLTTDYAFWAEKFPVEIATSVSTATVNINEAVTFPVQLTTQNRKDFATETGVTLVNSNELVVLGGTAGYQQVNGEVRFTSHGTAQVMPGYRYRMDGTYSYVIVSQPMTLNVLGEPQTVQTGVNSALAGSTECTTPRAGEATVCTVVAQPGYQVVTTQPNGTCPAGSWNASGTTYTSGVVTQACELTFSFASLPVAIPLDTVGLSGVIAATVSGGGATGAWAFDVAQLPTVSLPMVTPENLSFPYGVTRIDLTGGDLGSTAEVVLTYPQSLPAGARYYKYGSTAPGAAPQWYVYDAAVISGNTVRLPLTDGQLGDNDWSANREIRDPGGIAIATAAASTAVPVPTMGGGALFGLSCALGLLAWQRSRRQLGTGRDKN